MKLAAGFVVVKLAALAALALAVAAGCAHTGPNPCVGPDPSEYPCTCMDPRTPACPPPPQDSRKPDAGATR